MTEPNRSEPALKRWWWTKRLVPVAILFLAAAIGSRAWWGYYIGAKLDAVRRRVRARGESLEWAELEPPPVPAEENSAVVYLKVFREEARCGTEQALDALLAHIGKEQAEEVYITDLLADRSLRQKYAAGIGQLIDEAKPLLELLREARKRPGTNWNVDYSIPSFRLTLPSIQQGRRLSSFLALAALAAHQRGDGAAALEYVRDALALGRAIDRMPFLVPYLVRLSIEGVVARGLEQIIPDMRISSRPPGVPRADSRDLIDELLDAGPLRQQLVVSMLAERCALYDIFQWFRGGMSPFSDRRVEPAQALPSRLMVWWAIDPMWTEDQTFALRRMTRQVEAMKEPAFFPTKARMPEQWAVPEGLRGLPRFLSSMLLSYFDRVPVLAWRTVADRQMAGLALAIRLYEIDHGRRPKELSDLAPGYVEQLPADPFAADGSTYGYLPEADKPILYSIGQDGKDNREDYFAGRYFLEDGEKGALHFLDGDRPSLAGQMAASGPAPGSRPGEKHKRPHRYRRRDKEEQAHHDDRP